MEKGQVSRSAADVYEEFFVPALFEEWAPRVAEAGGIEPGQEVLDVACGTGVLTREVRKRVGPGGAVTGLDPNPGMLAVARRQSEDVIWETGVAEDMPFEDATFDTVVSQFGLMFFEDRKKALREMLRVLKPGGRMAVAVWDSLENTPGYAEMTRLLRRLFGEETAAALEAPFCLGDPAALRTLFQEAGVEKVEITTPVGTARFPSIRDWVHTDIRGWTLADRINDEEFALLLREAGPALDRFASPEGTVRFPSPAHIVTGTR